MDNRNIIYRQLLENPRFVAWVVGERPEDKAFWQDWQREDPAHPEILEQARLTIQAVAGKPVTMSDEYVTGQIRKALAEARLRESSEAAEGGTVRRLIARWWPLAASVVMFVGLGWGLVRFPREAPVATRPAAVPAVVLPSSDGLEVVRNADRFSKHVLLPDGSSVVLHKNSQVRYAKSFSGPRREVFLSGEAFFEVSKNPQTPFFVFANGLITKVVGTSFSVRAYGQDPQVIVVVKTGKVAVFAQNDQRAETLRNNRELAGMVLTPNQQVTFERKEIRLVKTKVSEASPADFFIESQLFRYESTPVSQVFASLEKAYGVDIVFDEELMARCSITATLGDEPLLKKLQWICTILEATCQVNGQQILITGKAC